MFASAKAMNKRVRRHIRVCIFWGNSLYSDIKWVRRRACCQKDVTELSSQNQELVIVGGILCSLSQRGEHHPDCTATAHKQKNIVFHCSDFSLWGGWIWLLDIGRIWNIYLCCPDDRVLLESVWCCFHFYALLNLTPSQSHVRFSGRNPVRRLRVQCGLGREKKRHRVHSCWSSGISLFFSQLKAYELYRGEM